MEANEDAKKMARDIAEELIRNAQIRIMGHTDSEWGKGYDEGHQTGYLGAAFQIATRFGLDELADQAFALLRK